MAAPKAYRYRCPVEDSTFTRFKDFEKHIEEDHPDIDRKQPSHREAAPEPQSAPQSPPVRDNMEQKLDIHLLLDAQAVREFIHLLSDMLKAEQADKKEQQIAELQARMEESARGRETFQGLIELGRTALTDALKPVTSAINERMKAEMALKLEALSPEKQAEQIEKWKKLGFMGGGYPEAFALMERMKAEKAPPSVSKPALSYLQQPAKCRICGQEFPTGQALGTHVQTVHPVPQTCRQCGNILPSVPSLMRHVHDKHPRPRRENPEPHRIAKVEYPPGRARGLDALFQEGGEDHPGKK